MVKIKEMKTNKTFGKVKAFFTISLGPLEITDCRLIEGQNGPFVGLPSKKITIKATGEEKWMNVVSYTYTSDKKMTPKAKELSDNILKAAIEEYVRRGGQLASEPQAVPEVEEEEDDLPF